MTKPEAAGRPSPERVLPTIEYRPVRHEEIEAIRLFLSENGWAERVHDPERFRRMVEGADRTAVAWEGSRVVGFARALCYGVSNGYLSTVAVAPDYRKRGIGRELVRRIVGDDLEITWVLRAGRDSGGFWERLGFRPSEIAMERVRRGSAPSSCPDGSSRGGAGAGVEVPESVSF